MKKLLIMSALALVAVAPAALADHHGKDKGHDGKPGEGMFEKHDTNGDGVISKDEFMAIHEEKFKEVDANGDGQITKEESVARAEEMRQKIKERQEAYRAKRKEERSQKLEEKNEEPSTEE